MVVEIHLEIQNLAQCLQGVDQFAQLEQLALLAQHLQGVVEMNSQRTWSRAIQQLDSWTQVMNCQ